MQCIYIIICCIITWYFKEDVLFLFLILNIHIKQKMNEVNKFAIILSSQR